MQTRVDLNADLGELDDGSLDAAVMPYISSCNIACGAHAGNSNSMRRTVRLAKKYGVSIGAHPGYPDPGNFGRVSVEFQTLELCALIRGQVLLLKQIAKEEGAAVYHIKLHGALYNDLAFDYERSLSVSKAIAEIDPKLRFIVFSGSEAARAAEDAGLVAIHEVFADRTYTEESKLVPRTKPGAVLYEEPECLAQAARFMDGSSGLVADSICVHGDNPSAVQFISKLRNFFADRKIEVRPSADLTFSFYPLGEKSMLAQLPARIAKSTHRKIRALQWALDGVEGILELVPCYAELKIDFDPTVISYEELCACLCDLEDHSTDLPKARRVEVPVWYQGEGLAVVAKANGLTEEEVVRLHSEPTYLIYMLGFSPGFAYMGGLNAKLTTPRLETPRVSVPAGSVGIAGSQTGIYPVESPGGWNIIGRTWFKLFDPATEEPFLFEPGDEVQFVPAEVGEEAALMSAVAEAVDPPDRFVKIIEPGMYTTVQDAGRTGYLRYGLPLSGTMDRRAFNAANALVGNTSNDAVLECTGTMPMLEFSQPTMVAVVYADRFQTVAVFAGEPVKFQPLETGYRAYIAIAGGIDVPMVMGSRSTYVSGKLGGFEGRILRAGDVLPVTNVAANYSRVATERFVCNAAGSRAYVRVIPGPEAEWFDCGGLNTFLTSEFTVSSKSDRTGLRLEGPGLSFRLDEQMISSGIAMGTIQVPPSGQPIVMMADHPTTGGYPRIGNVVLEDLSILAQLMPGDCLRFREERRCHYNRD